MTGIIRNGRDIVMPELLAPAGTLEKLKIAVRYGADAVYMGSGAYSLRAHAVMSQDDLIQGVTHAHAHGVKAYVTVNIMAHNRDLTELPDYLSFLREAGVDGLIIGDPGVFAMARRHVPEVPIHLSTQANVTNQESARFWQEQGAERLNLARELSLKELAEIRQAVQLKLEIFVHGALCISYSGRCTLSLYMTGRDANLGQCAHPCRYRYTLQEEKRPGQYFPVEEDERGVYIFNSKDLCLLHRLPALIQAGADSFKLEGRMKSVYYVGAIVRLYRAALDHIRQETVRLGPEALATISLPPNFDQELMKIGSRGYTENFFDQTPDENDMLHQGIDYQQTHAPVGIIREPGTAPLIEVRNPICLDDTIEYLGAGLSNTEVEVKGMTDSEGRPLQRANPNSLIRLSTSPDLTEATILGLLRKKASS
ncbi:MAG: U32 family peptidase [Proteobacteria bacterium]|nr:U32 family peptidase [Sideroxydans sp.]MBU4152314.1 U32 family peptidase [Pseudomonadota bacterium]MDP2104407.1 U32 family peptidase [Desulfobulbaceae bacterium]